MGHRIVAENALVTCFAQLLVAHPEPFDHNRFGLLFKVTRSAGLRGRIGGNRSVIKKIGEVIRCHANRSDSVVDKAEEVRPSMTIPASDAGDGPEVIDIILELVHDPLTPSFLL